MNNERKAVIDEFEGQESASGADGSIELVVIGALLTLLLVLGTPMLGKFTNSSEGPSLQVIREGE